MKLDTGLMDLNGNDGDNSFGFFELPKEIDEKTFYANALAEIALDKDSPEDIFIVGKFEPVETEYRQYVLGKGTAVMSYSATIGYDRKEEYKTTESKYVTEGSYYTCNGVQKRANSSGSVQVDVVKTRTVTDWHPFSGNYTGEHVDAIANDDKSDELDSYDYEVNCLASAKEYDANVSKSPAPLIPSSASIHSLEIGIKTRARLACERKLPGDRMKDFYCDGTVSLNIVESHVAPQYILKYKYLQKDYTLKAHSAKKSKIKGDIPSAKTEIETEIEQNKLVKSFNLITFVVLLFSIISAILFPITYKIIFTIVGIVSFITYQVIRSKVSTGLYLKKAETKKQTLISHLKKQGIEIPEKLQEVK